MAPPRSLPAAAPERKEEGMAALARACRWIDRLNETVGRAAAWLLLVMIAVVFLVVLLRYGLGWGRIWLQEAYLWLHAAAFLLGAAYTLRHDGHVRIDVFYARAGARARAWIDLAGGAVLLLPFLGCVLISSLPYVETSWSQLERSREPGGLPGVFLLKTLIPLMALLMLLQGLALMGKAWLGLRGRSDLLDTA
jgi:TRAP-type mannitol/chloroaromatic compound transport system permease small subunit